MHVGTVAHFAQIIGGENGRRVVPLPFTLSCSGIPYNVIDLEHAGEAARSLPGNIFQGGQPCSWKIKPSILAYRDSFAASDCLLLPHMRPNSRTLLVPIPVRPFTIRKVLTESLLLLLRSMELKFVSWRPFILIFVATQPTISLLGVGLLPYNAGRIPHWRRGRTIASYKVRTT